MSTTTTKDDKEIGKEIAAMEKVLNNLSYTQLAELLASKKQAEIEAVTHKLKEARGIVAALEAQLEKLGVVIAPVAKVKRGRKIKNSFPPTKKAKKSKGTRTSGVKDSVLAYLKKHGEASPADILKEHSGLNVASISQCLIGLVKAKQVTKKAGRGTPYVLKK